MHVAYIHQHFSTLKDMTGTRSYEMSKRLLAAGHRVTMISGAAEGADRRLGLQGERMEVNQDGIRVIYINEPYENKMGFWKRVTVFRRFAKKAQIEAEASGADLVFATSTPLTVGIPGMKAARRLRVPFVFEVRDPWPGIPIAMGIIRNPALKWYLHRMERKIYHAANHCIALSPGMVDTIVKTGVSTDKVTLIPNGCDTDLFRPDRNLPREEWIGDTDRCRFVFSGAHGRCNGLDALIDAAAELKRRHEGGIQFVCIGQGGLKARHIERSRREGLEDSILWHDPIPKEQFARILPTFDVGLMLLANYPIFYYGTSPNKFFDYIACGLPVLNNYPGWLADMIGANELGKAIAPDDPAAFAEACIWFRDHLDELEGMGNNARELSENVYARDNLADRFVRTLERVHKRLNSE